MPAASRATRRSNSVAPSYQRSLPWLLLSQVYWMSYKLLERRFYRLGVSASQARVLLVLYDAGGPVKPSLVATLLFQETQSITGILHRIESRGWVRRLPDRNDRRAVGLELTEKGRRVAHQVIEVSDRLYAELFSSAISATERRQLEAILRKVRRRAFRLPETDFKLRRAQDYAMWAD